MRKLFIPAFSIALFGLIGQAHAEMREWTQAASGRKIQAEFVGMKDDSTVTIKMSNGKSFDVPVSSLSEADQTFLKEKNMAKPEAPAAAPAGSGSKPPAGSGSKPPLPEGEVTLTLSNVHMCCKDCEEAALNIAKGSKVFVDEAVEFDASKKDGTITIKAPTGKAAEQAMKAALAKGFYGKPDNEAFQFAPPRGSADFTADTCTIKDIHICCGGCAKAIEEVLSDIDGVKEYDVKKGSSFVLKGEQFSPHNVILALREAGFGGKWQ